MFHNLVIGPMLGVTNSEDRLRHWKEMIQNGFLPLIEDRGLFLQDALPKFPTQFQGKVTSVILTFGYTTVNFEA